MGNAALFGSQTVQPKTVSRAVSLMPAVVVLHMSINRNADLGTHDDTFSGSLSGSFRDTVEAPRVLTRVKDSFA